MPTKISVAARVLFVSLVYVVLYGLMQVAAALSLLPVSANLADYQAKVLSNLFVCSFIAIAVSLVLYAAFGLLRERPILREVRFRTISASTVIKTIVLALALRGAVAVYGVFSESVPALQESLESAPDITGAIDSFPKLMLCFLLIVLVAPIFEEILFRGLVQTELMRGFPAWVSILLSSLIFGAMHGNLFQSLFTVFCGLAMGWCYYRTGSILTSIVLHITFNTSVLFQLMIYDAPAAVQIAVSVISIAAAFFAVRSIAHEYPLADREQ